MIKIFGRAKEEIMAGRRLLVQFLRHTFPELPWGPCVASPMLSDGPGYFPTMCGKNRHLGNNVRSEPVCTCSPAE